MLASNIPAKFPEVFANAADASHKRVVPQTSSDPNAASLHLGFPPNVFVDVAAGGEPMDGRDLNGFFNALSAWSQWYQLGGAVLFDSTMVTATGGYMKGARVASSVNPALIWVSTADSNTTNPDGGSAANWVAEGDLGHSYIANGGFVTVGPLIMNFGTCVASGSSGIVAVAFAKPFTVGLLARGAANDAGASVPSSWSGTGLPTLTGMNVSMSVAPAGGGAGVPAYALDRTSRKAALTRFLTPHSDAPRAEEDEERLAA